LGIEIPVSIDKEMSTAYIDYAMSVIVGRALPDVRDGLKPVHRRILYAMAELGLWHNRPYRKSARVVGDVLGKLHPHGDTAVYDALVRMAQPFSLRYPLIDGQGNFGSLDGDPAAAMRYTEVRLTSIAEEMLRDIEKDTVNFVPNFDNSFQEPEVLPTRIPNLLINGSAGIAVGMATNIPPHNLSEVVDGLLYLIDHPDASLEEVMEFIPGPDFPTGATICGRAEIVKAYSTGRGNLRVRSKVEQEVVHKRDALVVKEIPYQVNKANLVEKIHNLMKEGVLSEIAEVRDESDREGLRVVIELRKGEDPDFVLKKLYKYTQLETGFGIILIALDDGEPKLMDLLTILRSFLAHRREVVTRRTQFDLKKAEERLEVLEGLRIALANLDEVITLIKSSDSPASAKEGLINRFGLTPVQAQAILDMRLQRLTGLEREKIEAEYKALVEKIAELKAILEHEHLLWGVIKDELKEVKATYGDARRTAISDEVEEFNPEEMIKDEEVVVTITKKGFVKCTPLALYRSQRKGGRGKKTMEFREEDFIEQMYVASTHDELLFFTNRGKVHAIKVYELPQLSRQAKGKIINQFVRLQEDEKITAVAPLKRRDDEGFLVMVTRRGMVKRVRLSDMRNIRRGGIIAISLKEGDELIGVGVGRGDDRVIIATRFGKSILFPIEDVRPSGRQSQGVIGIRLTPQDEVVSMGMLKGGESILTVTERGYGKITPAERFRLQSRGGKGIIAHNCTAKTGDMVALVVVRGNEEMVVATREGMAIRTSLESVSVVGRASQGVKLIGIPETDSVVGVSIVREDEEEENQ